jgi:nitrate/nitrite-specific signal transduction histidine kinase
MEKGAHVPVSQTVDLSPPEAGLLRLKRLTILAPLVFFCVLDLLQHVLYPHVLAPLVSYLIAVGIVLAGTLAFSTVIFGVIDRMQARLVQQNRELLALHQAGLDVAGELELEAVLQKIVDRARELVGARYGALSLLREEGGIEAFLTSGISAEERALIGALPTGRGLLGVVLGEGQRLRLADLTGDPRSVGFPQNHPAMRSLVAVPIASHGRVLGNLYLTEAERGKTEFSLNDEETLVRFATQAALAIENARLHRRVQALAVAAEREWIARELHDTVAQVLGYVNTKAQAAQELLRGGQSERASLQIGQLAEAARAAYADVREGILGLRAARSVERGFRDTLRDYLEHWQEQSGITAEFDESRTGACDLRVSPLAEIQLLRIVQEALANVRKHARAGHVRVVLAERDTTVAVMVEDDGVGFDPAALGRAGFPRFGLATMRERAEAIGGTLEIESGTGRGTQVTIHIPAEANSTTEGVSHARTDC